MITMIMMTITRDILLYTDDVDDDDDDDDDDDNDDDGDDYLT